jgi:hypothetical protein
MLFKRLDANHDGVITQDEIPANAPEPLKALLKAADKNGDKKVTLEEFKAALKEHPLPKPPCGAPFGAPRGMTPPFAPGGGPGTGFWPPCPLGRPYGGPLGKAPDFKKLFAEFDKDKDGKLTLEEFTEGMKRLHKTMMERARPKGPMAGGPMPPPPMPGMMPQWGPGSWWMMGGPMPGWQGPAPRPGGAEWPATRPAAGPPPPGAEPHGRALDARIRDLEARVKALEADNRKAK